jgi:hypothetical protein
MYLSRIVLTSVHVFAADTNHSDVAFYEICECEAQ